jgi:hypothetical protein
MCVQRVTIFCGHWLSENEAGKTKNPTIKLQNCNPLPFSENLFTPMKTYFLCQKYNQNAAAACPINLLGF